MTLPVYCPDCPGQVEMDLITIGIKRHFDFKNDESIDEEYTLEEPYYKCPKCKGEFDPEDADL